MLRLKTKIVNLSVDCAFPPEVGTQELVAIECKALFVSFSFYLILIAYIRFSVLTLVEILQDCATSPP